MCIISECHALGSKRPAIRKEETGESRRWLVFYPTPVNVIFDNVIPKSIVPIAALGFVEHKEDFFVTSQSRDLDT
jgi:hypothetical protein